MLYLLFFALILLAAYTLKVRDKFKHLVKAKNDLEKQFIVYREKSENRTRKDRETISKLSKYTHILDVEMEASRIRKEVLDLQKTARNECSQKLSEADLASKQTMSEAKKKAAEIKAKADSRLAGAHKLAVDIERSARIRAEELAGSALEAKENAESYKAVEKAMRNVIRGYGDEYLSPNRSIINELVQEYEFSEAGQQLKKAKAIIQSMLKEKQAADCSYVEDYRRRTAIEFVLDAFNGKVDSILSRVKAHNHDKLEEKIIDAYNLVNNNGKAFRKAHIRKAYLDATLEQLKWAVIVQRIKEEDREEQRLIKEKMREEEKARREYEKARKDAEKEERLLQNAMREAEKNLLGAATEERAKYEEEIESLRASLEDALSRGERAMSMAQQTKQGHVYIISNVGSFGEEVVMVGLTRRLEPMDRVKELSGASVPFEFDVHAMIFSSDAPALEKTLHELLERKRVNKVNSRKEFFRVQIDEIRRLVEKSGYDVRWTIKAEASQYRESLKLEKINQSNVQA